MSKYTKWFIGAIALCVTVVLIAPSSFAATAMSDEELDATTAAGQSAVNKGIGDQTITDLSQANLQVTENAQEEITAGDLFNVVGENNVAGAVNLADTDSGTIDQLNEIDQSKAAYVDQRDGTLSTTDTGATSDSAQAASRSSRAASNASTASSQYSTGDKLASIAGLVTIESSTSEVFPENVNIDITGDTESSATAAAVTTASSDAKASSETTSTATSDVTRNDSYSGSGDRSVQIANDGFAPYSAGSENGIRMPMFGGSKDDVETVDATVNKLHVDLDTENDTTLTKADGSAGIAKADAEGHEQAYAVSAAEGGADAVATGAIDIDVDLPTAKSSTFGASMDVEASKEEHMTAGSASQSQTITENTSDEAQSSRTVTASRTVTLDSDAVTEVVEADHVKLGEGDQTITDLSEVSVLIAGQSQQDAVALNLVNVAGRNNVATAWNVGSSLSALDLSGGNIKQVNTISQVN
jgi:hypothetical protein